ELHRQFRMVIDAPWYRTLFPQMLLAKDTDAEIVTTVGGCRYATSINGNITGRGADLIVIDDPLEPEDAGLELPRQRVIDWFGGKLVSRPNDKERDPIIVVMQRLHEADLAGYLLEQGHWKHLELQAIAEEDKEIPIGPGRFFHRRRGDVLHPERESREALDKIRSEMGAFRFLAQYQQRPQPAQGSLLKPEWFRSYDRLPPSGPGDLVVQSWDVAITLDNANDYSVCTTWRMVGADYFLIDVFRARLFYPDLRR